MIDRRKTGINRVQISDGNGGEVDVYTMTMGRIRTWAGGIMAIAAVIGLVFAEVWFGGLGDSWPS